MKKQIMCYAAAVSVLIGLGGCVDDNYDLSDIDTTTRISVNDLVLPVNIDPITLSDIISIDEDSKIKVMTIDGKEFYALSETGDFHSDDIFVEKVTAEAPVLNPTTRTLDQVIAESAPSRAGEVADDYSCTYRIVEMGNDFTYSSDNIDEAIVELYSARVTPMDFKVHLDALNAHGKVDRMYFTDLVIQMPYGLDATVTEGGSYNPEDGLWTIARQEVVGSEADASLTTSAIDFAANGCHIINHSMKFDGAFRVMSGLLTIEPIFVNGQPVPLPEQLEFRVSYTIDDMEVQAFTGVINYKLKGMDIDPVNLDDIPDFLAGDETVLNLANPQIYLQLNNPVAGDALSYRTGLTLSAIRSEGPAYTFTPDAGTFTIGHDHGITGPYNFVLAPDEAGLTVPDDYESSLHFVKFSTLGDLLGVPSGAAVKGLPSQIGIALDDPCIPTSPVTDFALGRSIAGVDGRYELLAPLALKDGSMIVYTDTRDGWNDEDVDAITITKLSLSATATNNCPIDAVLTAWPIDKDGHRITGVQISSNTLPANAVDHEIVIEMTGTVTHLDGITFEARINPDESGKTLTPSQTITLDNVRARVTGYYEKEL